MTNYKKNMKDEDESKLNRQLKKTDYMTAEGIPFPHNFGRPTIIYHPSRGRHWLASWHVALTMKAPFILIANDRYLEMPDDDMFGVCDAHGQCPLIQVGDTYNNSKLYQHHGIEEENCLWMEEGDAAHGLASIPMVDILYLEPIWLSDWVDATVSFKEAAKTFAYKVRDNGLILLDRKPETCEFGPAWFDFPVGAFEVMPGVELKHLGCVSWVPQNGFDRMNGAPLTEMLTEVFVVRNNHLSGNLNDEPIPRQDFKNWFAAMRRTFLLRTIMFPEVNI